MPLNDPAGFWYRLCAIPFLHFVALGRFRLASLPFTLYLSIFLPTMTNATPSPECLRAFVDYLLVTSLSTVYITSTDSPVDTEIRK